MKIGPHGDTLRLKDILWAIAALDRHPVADRAVLDADELLQVFALKQIEVIGEAASKLSAALCDAHPEIPWAKMIGMRNRLVHDYGRVDWETVWAVLSQEIEPLRARVEAILKERDAHG